MICPTKTSINVRCFHVFPNKTTPFFNMFHIFHHFPWIFPGFSPGFPQIPGFSHPLERQSRWSSSRAPSSVDASAPVRRHVFHNFLGEKHGKILGKWWENGDFLTFFQAFDGKKWKKHIEFRPEKTWRWAGKLDEDPRKNWRFWKASN